ncbi:hypothetical protein CA54_31320 [Symmachiella macrocystis]|uniref:DUF3352 domain-containing protein n=1 Tax=Symmachiella macrocystis TaxID=2527985 RepID=A0A5C6BQF2_9PLAN|nr:hypothetical protein [Symmachiella macrocystis]TWU14288.1 hypothetical protein CA54_31320 [Symmachiella macrocystis]
MSGAGMGFAEILLILLTGGGLGPLMGMPPGPRDEALLRLPPTNAIVYTEWAARGTGKEGAPGIEGMIADQEVSQFLEKVHTAIVDGIIAETENRSPEEQVLGEVLPRLGFELLKHPGCLYLSYEEDHIINGDTPPAMMMSVAQGVRFALVINGEKQADQIAADFLELTQFLPGGERRESLDHLQIPVPLPGIPVTVHRHNDYFILALGDGTLDAAIVGLDGKSNGLADAERFQGGVKRVSFERSGGLTWVDTRQLLKVVTSILEPAGIDAAGTAEMLGLDSLDYFVSSSGMETNGQISCRNFIATGGKTNGILKLAAGRGIKTDDLQHIPADADFAFAMSFDAAQILEEVRQILSAVGPGPAQALEDAIQEIDNETGLSIETDVLTAVGDVWTLHNSPSGGGLLFSGIVLTVDIRDAEQAQATYDKIMELIKLSLPGVNEGFRARGAEMKNRAFLGQDIDYLNVVGDDDVPLAPALCLTKDRLYLALHPQSIKSQLRFLKSKEKSFANQMAVDFKLPDGDLLSLTYWDAEATTKLLYSLVPYFGQMIMTEVQSNAAVTIDIFDIPSARALLPYIGPYTSSTVRTPEGIMTTSTSTLPLPIGSAMSTIMPMLGLRRAQHFAPVQEAVPADADF